MQRRALGLLFCLLAAALTAIAIAGFVDAGGGARGWIIGIAALAIAAWLGSAGLSALRR